MKKLLLFLTAVCGFAQTSNPTPLYVYGRTGITSDTIIDNRNTTNRAMTYVSVACSGSGSWQAQLQHSSDNVTYTSFGSGATISQLDAIPIAYGFLFNPPNYIKVDITGTTSCKLSGFQNLFVSTATASVSYPVDINLGGTNATTASQARTNLGVPWTVSGNNIYYNAGTVSIGTTSSGAPFTISAQSTLASPPSGTLIHNSGSNGGVSLSILDAYAAVPAFITRRAEGTAASPTNVLTDQVIYISGGRGYGATGFSSTNRVSIWGSASENWTDNAHGTQLEFRTTTNGTTTETRRWLIDNAGNLLAGTDNQWDIGTSVNYRPKDVFIARNLSVGGTTTLTTPLAISSGGTAATTASQARANLGITSGSATGTATQYLRGTPNVTATSYDFTNTPRVYAKDYAWSYTNGGQASANLSVAGSNTITLTPCPLGIYGVITTTAVRISGGTGTAEQALITGGTCTSGASTGTITLITVNTHTGSWNVGSATGGIQEAVQGVQDIIDPQGNLTGGALILPQGATTVYAPITMGGSVPAVTIFGSGMWSTVLNIDSTFTSGDVFYCPGTTCLVSFYDFTIAGHANHSSGAAIHIKDSASGTPVISNVRVTDAYGGFYIDNSDYVYINNGRVTQSSAISNPNSNYGLLISGTSSDIEVIGGTYTAPEIDFAGMMDYGIRITGGDGVYITGPSVRGNVGLSILGASSSFLGSVFFQGVLDRSKTYQVDIQTTGTPSFFGNIQINNSHIMGIKDFYVGVDTDLININTSSLGTTRSGIKFTNNLIANANRNCFLIVGTYDVSIQNNNITNCNAQETGAYSGIQIADGGTFAITGNTFEDTNGTPKMDYALNLSGTISNLNLSGNSSINIPAPTYLNNATLTNTVYGNNIGATNFVGTIASAATITVAPYFYSQFGISGTTTINTINGWTGTGDTRKFFCPSGLTFSAAGNLVGTPITTSVAGQVVTCTWHAVDNKAYCN